MRAPNKPVEPTGTSQSCQRAFADLRRLVPAAHRQRWAKTLSNMASLARFNLGAIGAVVLVTGCAHVPHMTQSQVILAAGHAGQAAGYLLVDYEEPDAHFEFTDKDRTWSVFYQGRVASPGNHFLVVVDDRTAATRVVGGR